jgi:hypothetical protein
MLEPVLDIVKALTFFASLASLYWAGLAAFFQPGRRWEERLAVAAGKLVITGCVCCVSGVLFRWPAKTNPDAGVTLLATLPMRMFLWGSVGIAVLFAASWYLVCGTPCLPNIARSCGCS